MMKAIRGAITVDENTAEAIRESSIMLLETIAKANHFALEDVVQVIFSATKDINAAYPARFAREIGWDTVPLFCVQEMAVEGALAMCLRVLITIDTDQTVQHVYLKGAKSLRPDLAN